MMNQNDGISEEKVETQEKKPLNIVGILLGALVARSGGQIEINYAEIMNVRGVNIKVLVDKIIINGEYHDLELLKLLNGFDSEHMEKCIENLKTIIEEKNKNA